MNEDESLKTFFSRYGEAFDRADLISTFYGDFAVASTPSFVGCLKGTEEIKTAFAAVADYQVKTGMTSLIPLKTEPREVDKLHLWVKVKWEARFKKTGETPIVFDVSYLLRRSEKDFVILLYVSHQDEQQLRAQYGLN